MKNKSNHNRRDFLKKSLQSAAVAAVAPGFLGFSENNAGLEENMVYRTLGRTGIKIPIISMGTGDTDNPNLIKAAIDSGITLLATSQYYGNGNNERIVGEVIKNYDRDKMIVMTSAMPEGVDHKEGLFTEQSKGDAFIKKIEGSLQRLGVDYLDICILPFAAKRESVFFEPLLKTMEKIKNQGMAKYVGVATHKFEHEAVRAAAEVGVYDIVMTAYNFKRKNIVELDEAIEFAAGKGVGIIAMKTMAGVYWDKEKTMPINTKAALKWALQNENIHTAVPGFTTFDEMKQDLAIASDLKLTEEEKKDLKLAQNNSRHGIYCQQCGICTGQCKESLDIPTLMRSYMYAFGYGNFSHAKSNLDHAALPSKPCSNCSTCTIDCTMGFDIKNKVQDIARIGDIPEEFLA
jgi:predicted aldo/keto reductase-like oxidoreductase